MIQKISKCIHMVVPIAAALVVAINVHFLSEDIRKVTEERAVLLKEIEAKFGELEEIIADQQAQIEDQNTLIEELRQKIDTNKDEINKVKETTSLNQTNMSSFVVTAYTAGFESTGKRPGDKAYGITASGERVKENHSLACPPRMPFGTRIEIEGIGIRTCVDRGAHIKGNRLDIYMEDLDQALEFGKQRLKVTVISK